MKQITLTQGKVSLVDDADYDWLMQYKWCAMKTRLTYYAVRGDKIIRRLVLMHRELLGLSYGDNREVDHIHHNGLDNRRSEIRIVTSQQNQFNRQGVLGFCWDKRSQKYMAHIKLNGHFINLGYYSTAEDARKARQEGKIRYHQIPQTMLAV